MFEDVSFPKKYFILDDLKNIFCLPAGRQVRKMTSESNLI